MKPFGLPENYLNPASLDCTAQAHKDELEADERKFLFSATVLVVCMALGLIIMIGGCTVAHAEVTDEQLVNAIGKAENSKSHPYGIMAKYKHTSPRQACFNTVRHKRRDWVKQGSKGDFIAYLARKYSPIGACNDPKGLNCNWERNVRYFLKAGA